MLGSLANSFVRFDDAISEYCALGRWEHVQPQCSECQPRHVYGLDLHSVGTCSGALYCRLTPPELDFRPVYEFIPNIIVQTAIMSFVFAVVIFGIFRKKKGQPADLQDALEFAQSKAKARKDGTTDVTLDDVAGLDSVKNMFEEIVQFLKDPEQFKATGVKPPKGVLLEGPPGLQRPR